MTLAAVLLARERRAERLADAMNGTVLTVRDHNRVDADFDEVQRLPLEPQHRVVEYRTIVRRLAIPYTVQLVMDLAAGPA